MYFSIINEEQTVILQWSSCLSPHWAPDIFCAYQQFRYSRKSTGSNHSSPQMILWYTQLQQWVYSVLQLHPSELIMVEFPSSKSRITRLAYVNVPVTGAWDVRVREAWDGVHWRYSVNSTKSSAWAFKSNSKEERKEKNDSLLRLLAARHWGDVWIRLGVIEKEKSEGWGGGLECLEALLKSCFCRKMTDCCDFMVDPPVVNVLGALRGAPLRASSLHSHCYLSLSWAPIPTVFWRVVGMYIFFLSTDLVAPCPNFKRALFNVVQSVILYFSKTMDCVEFVVPLSLMRASFEMMYNPWEADDMLTHWPVLQSLDHNDL